MKIGLARRGYSPWGGAEAYLTRFAEALLAAGHDPVLLGIEEWPRGSWPGEEVVYLPGRSPRAFADAVEKRASAAGCERVLSLERLWRCDVYRAGDGVHRAWLERRKAFEPGWRSWFRSFQAKHRQLIALEESLFARGGAGKVIVNSRMVKDEIERHYGYPAGRIEVIYNGLPERALRRTPKPEDRARLRREWGVGDDDYVLLFAGSGWERKGLRYALQAVNEAKKCDPLLVVAGRGNPGGYPSSSRVRYAGPVRGIGAYYAAADAFLLPTLYDPFSNACLEALAAGLPVITSRANGFSEVITPGLDGEAVENPADTPALARAIEAWSSRERRETAHPRLRERTAQFTIQANVCAALPLLVN